MSQSQKTAQPKTSPATAVVLFGLDENKKPKAARFPEKLSQLAVKAAQQLKLNVLHLTTPDATRLAASLPVGRISASGRGLLSNVKQDVYDQLVSMAQSAPAPTQTVASTVTSGTASAKVPKNEAGTDDNPAGSEGLPASWADIKAGHLVLAQESRHDGWAEVIVVERRDDILTVRWRDYPKWKPFTCHVDAVAIINAKPSFKAIA
jgi:hypothetical protein